METVIKSLNNILGPEYVSDHPEEKFIYSRDMGTMPPAFPDCVVMPDTTEQVRQILSSTLVPKKMAYTTEKYHVTRYRENLALFTNYNGFANKDFCGTSKL